MRYPKTPTTADRKMSVPWTIKPTSEAAAEDVDMFQVVQRRKPGDHCGGGIG